MSAPTIEQKKSDKEDTLVGLEESMQPIDSKVEPAGEFIEPSIPPDLSGIVKPVPTIPAIPTGVSGVEPAKEAVPPVYSLLPPMRNPAVVAKGSVVSSRTWNANLSIFLEEKRRGQEGRKAA